MNRTGAARAANNGRDRHAQSQTFTNELKALHTMKELNDLDAQVNQFIEANQVQRVVSVSDSCTSAGGNTIGIIRVLTYESD